VVGATSSEGFLVLQATEWWRRSQAACAGDVAVGPRRDCVWEESDEHDSTTAEAGRRLRTEGNPGQQC